MSEIAKTKRHKPVWKCVRFDESMVDSLLSLFETVNGTATPADVWKWQYICPPAGRAFVRVADHDGRTVGHQAIFPLQIKIGDRYLKGAQALDAMTHPDYRRQGIFVTLADEVYSEAESEQVELIYGFPNSQSIHGLTERLGFFTLETIAVHVRPMSLYGAIARKSKTRLLASVIGTPTQFIFDLLHRTKSHAKVRVSKVERFPMEVDNLFRRLADRFRNMVVRNAEYLNWRYADHPSKEYEILLAHDSNGILCGYCVVGKRRKTGLDFAVILDLFADPEDDLTVSALLKQSMCVARMNNDQMLCCAVLSESPFLRSLKKSGFIISRKNFPFIIRLNSSTIEIDDVNRIRDWHVMLGDSDFM